MINWPSKVTDERIELVSESAHDLDLNLLLRLADTCRELQGSGLYHEVIVDYDTDRYGDDPRIRILGVLPKKNPDYAKECVSTYQREKRYLETAFSAATKSLKKKSESRERLIARQQKSPLREDLYLEKVRELDSALANLSAEIRKYEEELKQLEQEYKERSV